MNNPPDIALFWVSSYLFRISGRSSLPTAPFNKPLMGEATVHILLPVRGYNAAALNLVIQCW